MLAGGGGGGWASTGCWPRRRITNAPSIQRDLHLGECKRSSEAKIISRCCLVGLPDLGQKTGRMRALRHHLVGLDLGVGDGALLQWIGNHHPLHVRCHQLHHCHRVCQSRRRPRRFRPDVWRKQSRALARDRSASGRLGETAMDVEPNDSHVLLLYLRFIEEHEGQHNNYGSALAAQPGRSQGRSESDGQFESYSDSPMQFISAFGVSLP
jgi:hypothetical protein